MIASYLINLDICDKKTVIVKRFSVPSFQRTEHSFSACKQSCYNGNHYRDVSLSHTVNDGVSAPIRQPPLLNQRPRIKKVFNKRPLLEQATLKNWGANSNTKNQTRCSFEFRKIDNSINANQNLFRGNSGHIKASGKAEKFARMGSPRLFSVHYAHLIQSFLLLFIKQSMRLES